MAPDTAVHEVQGWGDLRRRPRRIAGATPCSTGPCRITLIFIDVALTRGMTGQVRPLLALDSVVDDPARADCAIFYFITNCRKGCAACRPATS